MFRSLVGHISLGALIALPLDGLLFAADPVASPAPDVYIVNPTFTYTYGAGSLDGWKLHGVAGENLKVLYEEGTLNDLASLRTGAAISQIIGRGYRLSAGDRISVTFQTQNEWEGQAVRLVLFHGDSPANVLAEKIVPVTNELLPTTYVFTVPARAAYLGASLGLHFSSVGPVEENRWVLIDEVDVVITSAVTR